MKYPARGLVIVLMFCFALPAMATQRNVQTYGATGNGSTDDRAAINSAIAALAPGDELYFPCPSVFYLISSGLNRITVNNVTIDGQTGCSNGQVTIKDTGSGSTIMIVGNGSLSATTPITELTAELDTTFQANLSAIGAAGGDYVYLTELNGIDQNVSGGTNTNGLGHCSVSGCRNEVLKLLSVNGSTGTVTTAVHFAYDPNNDASCPLSGGCSPTVQKITNPTTGIYVHDLTFDGGSVAAVGFEGDGLVNSTFTNLKAQNVIYTSPPYGLVFHNGFNNSWNTIETTNCGDLTGDGVAFGLYGQGSPNVNGVNLHTPYGPLFGFIAVGTSGGTFQNIMVDYKGASRNTGRPVKTVAAVYNTWTGVTASHSVGSYVNGISLATYSQHNVFNNCVTNGNAGFGINLFDNSGAPQGGQTVNGYNTFNNCTSGSNTGYQFYIGQYSTNVEINGGTYSGLSGNNAPIIQSGTQPSDNLYIHDTTINGPSGYGIYIQGNTACINNNTFGASTFASGTSAIDIALGTGSVGSGNTLNGYSSNLGTGTCGTRPAPPTSLTATVN